EVIIEIVDDGRGIQVDKVVKKAVERGVLTADRASRLSPRDAFGLIFAPGFSTAEKVTNVSGRGVGMDVVKTNIEKIGGSVDVNSESGRGTTIRIKIPLTLAIIPALIVSSGPERFAIPQVSLLELVRLEAEQARTAIELICDAPVYRLRGELLPLVYLNRALEVKARPDPQAPVNIVVLQADGRPFGLVVERVSDTAEIVVKPLGKQLKNLSHFAGATIMGDGQVALILDVLGLAQASGVISEVREQTLMDQTDAKTTAAADDRRTLVVLRVGEKRRVAVPLSSVARLEEIQSKDIEHAGTRAVVQYRGQLLPLLRIEDYIAGGTAVSEWPELVRVVVYNYEGRSVGLVANQIEDIVDERISVERTSGEAGISGSVVLQGRVTDVLDVNAILSMAGPDVAETALAA
ncbi:MAG: chemotaxis protein CheW, partial [Candidatus Eisenbacteria bacterium]|nr:chemotaxis protein CheW [Candidatus Eisenbacteria bacterium]